MSSAIDPRMVIRTEPRQFTVNFEPNYLSGIEFDTPDFPWLFTPAAPNGDRLRPWVALIVLKYERIYRAVRRAESSADDRGANDVRSAGSFRLVELGARADQRRCFSCGLARQRAGQRNLAVAVSAAARSRDLLLRVPGAGISKWRAGRAGPGCFSGVTTSDPAWTQDTQGACSRCRSTSASISTPAMTEISNRWCAD